MKSGKRLSLRRRNSLFSELLLPGRCFLHHIRLLLIGELLQASLPICNFLCLCTLLCFLLLLEALLLLFWVVEGLLHSLLAIELIPDELAVHAVHRHPPWTACLLDAIPVVLVDLFEICDRFGSYGVCMQA